MLQLEGDFLSNIQRIFSGPGRSFINERKRLISCHTHLFRLFFLLFLNVALVFLARLLTRALLPDERHIWIYAFSQVDL